MKTLEEHVENILFAYPETRDSDELLYGITTIFPGKIGDEYYIIITAPNFPDRPNI